MYSDCATKIGGQHTGNLGLRAMGTLPDNETGLMVHRSVPVSEPVVVEVLFRISNKLSRGFCQNSLILGTSYRQASLHGPLFAYNNFEEEHA